MMIAFSEVDSLTIEYATVEVSYSHIVGTIHGVTPLHASAANEQGTGYLTNLGSVLQWRAPDSDTYGPEVECTEDGNYVLMDGEDCTQWIRVAVDVSELLDTDTAAVDLSRLYNNAVAYDDVTASEASAGDVTTYTVNIKNQSNTILTQVKAWIAVGTTGIEISDDGAAWVSPTSEATALAMANLSPNDTDVLHIRRTITAGASADGDVTTLLHFSYRR